MLQYHFAFYSVDTRTDVEKAIVNKPSDVLTQMRTAAPNCTSHCILHLYAILVVFITILLFFIPTQRHFFHFFLEREEGSEEGRERNIDLLSPIHAWMGDHMHLDQ